MQFEENGFRSSSKLMGQADSTHHSTCKSGDEFIYKICYTTAQEGSELPVMFMKFEKFAKVAN
jgi:hypothetical protein